MKFAIKRTIPTDVTRSDQSRLLQLAAVAVPIVVGAVLIQELREPFDPVRLAVKSSVPFAALLPAIVLLPAGTRRAVGAAAIAFSAMGLATWSCLAVFGVPLDREVLFSILALTRPDIGSLLLSLALLGVAVAVRRWRGTQWTIWGSLSNVAVGAAEAVYFGGFLLASTANLGAWSWSLVGTGLALSASLRGACLWRALGGAVAMVAITLWSGSPYAAFLTHLALLGSPMQSGVGGLTLGPATAGR